ncbi:hypothetical protein [Streptomyces sp. NPDC096013]|uniref:hypothetical protein n=1 Tax=Streptomyces sp. NPDC096013 TaxID=3366069 RepID=UPI00382159EA
MKFSFCAGVSVPVTVFIARMAPRESAPARAVCQVLRRPVTSGFAAGAVKG